MARRTDRAGDEPRLESHPQGGDWPRFDPLLAHPERWPARGRMDRRGTARTGAGEGRRTAVPRPRKEARMSSNPPSAADRYEDLDRLVADRLPPGAREARADCPVAAGEDGGR